MCTVNLKELSNNSSQISVSSEIKNNAAELSITPNTDGEWSNIFVLRKVKNGWQPTALTPDESSGTELKNGMTSKINLINYYSDMLTDENLKYLYESFNDYIAKSGKVPDDMAEMGLTADTDINSFKNALSKYFSVDTDGEYMAVVIWTVDEKNFEKYVLIK